MTFFKTDCFHTEQDKNYITSKGWWKPGESFHLPITENKSYIKRNFKKMNGKWWCWSNAFTKVHQLQQFYLQFPSSRSSPTWSAAPLTCTTGWPTSTQVTSISWHGSSTHKVPAILPPCSLHLMNQSSQRLTCWRNLILILILILKSFTSVFSVQVQEEGRTQDKPWGTS